MAREKEDFPPLLPAGEHVLSVEEIRSMCVDDFPLSVTRAEIMRGFEIIFSELLAFGIPCDIVFDGSFLTKEIDPDDVDFAVVVTPEFFESCNKEQTKYLEWIRDEFSIKETHKCDCYLVVEYPPSHPLYCDGDQNRAFWVNLYSKSIIYQ